MYLIVFITQEEKTKIHNRSGVFHRASLPPTRKFP